MPKKFSPELRDRAVRMVYVRQARDGGPHAASIRAVAPQLGVGEETLRIWCNRYGPTERLNREIRRRTDSVGSSPPATPSSASSARS